jgi:hypothetical protein
MTAFRPGAESAGGYQPRATPWVQGIILGRALKGREGTTFASKPQPLRSEPSPRCQGEHRREGPPCLSHSRCVAGEAR